MAIVYVNCEDRKQRELNVSALSTQTTNTRARVMIWEDMMPRFYFNLMSRDNHIADNAGRELASLNDAYAHARTLIDKILFHLGHDDAAEWKVVISNDNHDAQMIVPFPVSALVRSQRRGVG
jgi:3-hydroxyisobutyrate dehydrogenase-like beta-hydroxyacid dehydrogenase